MESVFQDVFSKIEDHLPSDWQRVAIYFAKVNKMMDFKYYVDTGDGYVVNLRLADYDGLECAKLTIAIDKLLMAERDKLPKKQQWSVFTMFIDSSGKFKVDYYYDNISKTFPQYKADWESKFIYNK